MGSWGIDLHVKEASQLNRECLLTDLQASKNFNFGRRSVKDNWGTKEHYLNVLLPGEIAKINTFRWRIKNQDHKTSLFAFKKYHHMQCKMLLGALTFLVKSSKLS